MQRHTRALLQDEIYNNLGAAFPASAFDPGIMFYSGFYPELREDYKNPVSLFTRLAGITYCYDFLHETFVAISHKRFTHCIPLSRFVDLGNASLPFIFQRPLYAVAALQKSFALVPHLGLVYVERVVASYAVVLPLQRSAKWCHENPRQYCLPLPPQLNSALLNVYEEIISKATR
jgi:hypothetical protein